MDVFTSGNLDVKMLRFLYVNASIRLEVQKRGRLNAQKSGSVEV